MNEFYDVTVGLTNVSIGFKFLHIYNLLLLSCLNFVSHMSCLDLRRHLNPRICSLFVMLTTTSPPEKKREVNRMIDYTE